MAERIFCVDFGAAFTKVALRTATQETSALIPYPDTGLDLWAPTVVAADWKNGSTKPGLSFGEEAAGRSEGAYGGGRIVLYTNFKRDLFSTAPSDKSALHPLEELLQSAEFEALAAKYSVQPQWVSGLRSIVLSARTVFGSAQNPVTSVTRKQDEAKTVARYYFKWLHGQVLKACQKLPHTALSYADIPLRISVPVLGEGEDLDNHPGCVRLRDALNATGWKLDERPFVSEPEGNAVGILTKATNVLTKKKQINLGGMFDKGPLVTVLKGDKNHPTYRALVIDVGAFTTDFAALAVDTGGKAADSTHGAGFRLKRASVEYGIFNLDANVRAALGDEKREAIDKLSPKDLAEFQIRAYTDETGFRLPNKLILGGPADRSAVEKCLGEFTARLASETATFLQQLDSASMQELILTGGGCNIPSVRDALIKAAAAAPGSVFVKTHAPGLKKAKNGPPVDPLDDKFARGASALGGASIYFEKSYY